MVIDQRAPIDPIGKNLSITRKRSREEKLYSVMKRTYRGNLTFFTTVPRVRVKVFMYFVHNLFNLLSLLKKGKIANTIGIH